jgi:hypothetical protein
MAVPRVRRKGCFGMRSILLFPRAHDGGSRTEHAEWARPPNESAVRVPASGDMTTVRAGRASSPGPTTLRGMRGKPEAGHPSGAPRVSRRDKWGPRERAETGALPRRRRARR